MDPDKKVSLYIRKTPKIVWKYQAYPREDTGLQKAGFGGFWG